MRTYGIGKRILVTGGAGTLPVVIALTRSKSRIGRRKLPKDDPRQRKPDISLARKVLGWSPKLRLDDGLPRVVEYVRKIAA